MTQILIYNKTIKSKDLMVHQVHSGEVREDSPSEKQY